MIRRYGEAVQPGQTYRRRPGAYAILWDGDAMLATFQAEPTPELQLPGGGIDPGEHPAHALHREVLEETGWAISSPRRLGAFRRFAYMPEYDLWAEKLCHIYVARPVIRRSAPTEPHHSAVWIAPPAALKMLANKGDADFVRAYFGL